MKYKTVKKLWFAAAILTTTTSLWTNVNAMETPTASGAGVIRALNEQRILSEQYALQQIQTGAGELAEGEAAGEAGIDGVAELSLVNAEEGMLAADQTELAVAIAPNYVNIRKEPSTEGEVLGKLYRNTVGVIEASEEGWYYITSGSVSGYVSAEYVCVGEEAGALAEEIGIHLARVTTTTLKVRTEASTEAAVLGLVPEGDILTVTETLDGWLKVDTEEGEGYVAADYVEAYTEYPHAESIQEEAERLAREEAARRAAQEAEAKRKEAEQQTAAQKKAAAQQQTGQKAGQNQNNRQQSTNHTAAGNSSTGTTAGNSTSGASTAGNAASGNSGTGASASNAGLGQQIANYGLQFVGNPYVYGGTSLTNGADCSGFVQSVYKNFGINLPRTSGEQGACGSAVASLAEAQPGDLIWYSGHIGIYIGNGQIVHASSAKTGIKVSNANYRTILSIRRIV
ncbi:C40 family peptidase [Thermoguttaceae bacterium LCP21S3_D4]|nr:NlpC/P60 family protein [Lachnospiraceae bacterium]MDD6303586.1 NlpC/P60 family protein [Lachnospiraceae bacterium]HCJ75092.1 hydrolase Nlp/P60 [Roseburia sp.]